MASTISAGTTTTTALVYSADTSGVLQLQTNGTTTAVTIDTSQRVLIGTTSGSYGLVVGTGATDIRAQINGSTQYQLQLVNGSNSGFWIGSPSSDAMAFSRGDGVERARIDSSGRLLIGLTSQLSYTAMLTTASSLTANSGATFQDTATSYGTGSQYISFLNSSNASAGYIYHSASTAVQFTQTSDKRLKTDDGIVTDVSYLDKTQVHDFTWTQCGTKDRGIFAQDEYENNPRNIQVGKDDLTEDGNIKNPWTVNYMGYIPDLIVYCQQLKKTIQELSAQVTTLQTQVTALQSKG